MPSSTFTTPFEKFLCNQKPKKIPSWLVGSAENMSLDLKSSCSIKCLTAKNVWPVSPAYIITCLMIPAQDFSVSIDRSSLQELS